jgi:hypothetical protein
MCGDIYARTSEKHYKYLGTVHGNRNLREIIPIMDKEEKTNEIMALEADPAP